MTKMRTLVIAIALSALTAGCSSLQSLFERGGDAQQNPAVQGAINVASQKQCRQYAVSQPEQARTAGQYLSTVAGAAEACIDGINAGLAAGTATSVATQPEE